MLGVVYFLNHDPYFIITFSIYFQTENVMDVSFNPAFNSTIICNDDSSLSGLTSREDGSVELDEKSGLFKVTMQPEPVISTCDPYSNPDIEVSFFMLNCISFIMFTAPRKLIFFMNVSDPICCNLE